MLVSDRCACRRLASRSPAGKQDVEAAARRRRPADAGRRSLARRVSSSASEASVNQPRPGRRRCLVVCGRRTPMPRLGGARVVLVRTTRRGPGDTRSGSMSRRRVRSRARMARCARRLRWPPWPMTIISRPRRGEPAPECAGGLRRVARVVRPAPTTTRRRCCCCLGCDRRCLRSRPGRCRRGHRDPGAVRSIEDPSRPVRSDVSSTAPPVTGRGSSTVPPRSLVRELDRPLPTTTPRAHPAGRSSTHGTSSAVGPTGLRGALVGSRGVLGLDRVVLDPSSPRSRSIQAKRTPATA